MNLVTWQEFQELVPGKIETVLLPAGTLEPHGVLPNGSDNLAPEAMARELAAGLNAMIAPTLNYGVTGSMKAFPGAFAISEKAYRTFIADIFRGLSRNKFVNIIVLNGHGTVREMNLVTWQEFQELVPEKIETVLLPVGTLEPHGVLPNGSDNLAPEAHHAAQA